MLGATSASAEHQPAETDRSVETSKNDDSPWSSFLRQLRRSRTVQTIACALLAIRAARKKQTSFLQRYSAFIAIPIFIVLLWIASSSETATSLTDAVLDFAGIEGSCNGFSPAQTIEVLPRFTIVIECRNCKTHIQGALRSLAKQTLSNFSVLLSDDSSEDYSVYQFNSICANLSLECNVVKAPRQLGPAHRKWQAFNYLAKIGRKERLNDYIFMMESHDYLVDERALRDVAQHILATGAWVMFGRHRGNHQWSCTHNWQQGVPIRNCSSGTCVLNVPWSFCHPRILRHGLVHGFLERDFYFPSDSYLWGNLAGKWLPKATDRTWMYRAIDQAGPSRIAQFEQRAIVYRRNSIESEQEEENDSDLQKSLLFSARTPQSSVYGSIHVLTVVNDRVDLLDEWIQKNVVSQRTPDHSITLHVVSNNTDVHASVDNAVVKLKDRFRYYVYHRDKQEMPVNPLHDIGAVIFAKHLVDHVVTIDDDVMMSSEDALFNAWKQRRPMALGCLFGLSVTRKQVSRDKNGAKLWDYCSGGVSIIDASFYRIWETYAKFGPVGYPHTSKLWVSYLLSAANWDVFQMHVNATDIKYESGKPSADAVAHFFKWIERCERMIDLDHDSTSQRKGLFGWWK